MADALIFDRWKVEPMRRLFTLHGGSTGSRMCCFVCCFDMLEWWHAVVNLHVYVFVLVFVFVFMLNDDVAVWVFNPRVTSL